jgi:hypothetical protein
MNNWLHNLPIVWMGFAVFGFTALVTAAIYVVVMALSVGSGLVHSKRSDAAKSQCAKNERL